MYNTHLIYLLVKNRTGWQYSFHTAILKLSDVLCWGFLVLPLMKSGMLGFKYYPKKFK
jgi:hypothetical protein